VAARERSRRPLTDQRSPLQPWQHKRFRRPNQRSEIIGRRMTIESAKSCRTRPVKVMVPPKYDVARSVYARGLDRRSEGLRQTSQATEMFGGSRRQLQ